MLARVSRLCLALPEAEVRADRFAHAFEIRRDVFVYLFAVEDPAGRPIPMLVCRAEPDERRALLAAGHPFFAPHHGRDRIGIVLGRATDWTELEELVTESYRLLAPTKLAARMDADYRLGERHRRG
jgi:hypothetical protein